MILYHLWISLLNHRPFEVSKRSSIVYKDILLVLVGVCRLCNLREHRFEGLQVCKVGLNQVDVGARGSGGDLGLCLLQSFHATSEEDHVTLYPCMQAVEERERETRVCVCVWGGDRG